MGIRLLSWGLKRTMGFYYNGHISLLHRSYLSIATIMSLYYNDQVSLLHRSCLSITTITTPYYNVLSLYPPIHCWAMGIRLSFCGLIKKCGARKTLVVLAQQFYCWVHYPNDSKSRAKRRTTHTCTYHHINHLYSDYAFLSGFDTHLHNLFSYGALPGF